MSKIDDLKGKLAKLEASAHFDALLPKDAGWFSRKLLVLLAVIGVLVFLGRDNIGVILNLIGYITIAYIVVQGFVDACKSRDDRITRCTLIVSMAKDGLTEEELAAISGKPADPAATP
jgi:hypothetical protein